MQAPAPTIRADFAHGEPIPPPTARSGADPGRTGLSANPTNVDQSHVSQPVTLEQVQECLLRHFEEQQRLLRSEESRLDREARELSRQRAQLAQESEERRSQWEFAAQQLDARSRLLEERLQLLAREQEELRRQRQQLLEESARQQEIRRAELAEESRRLADLRRAESAGGPELLRMQLEASARELHQRERAFRAHCAAWEADLRQQAADLERERDRLRRLEEAWHDERERCRRLHEERLVELAGLDQRIRSYWQKLRTLREEAAALEHRLCAAADERNPSVDRPANAAAPEIGHPRFQGDLQAFLAQVIEDLADQCRCLQEQQEAIARIKRQWEWEWEESLAELADRDQALAKRESMLVPREHSLALAERQVQHRDADLKRIQVHNQCWEARLFRQETSLRFQRRRLLAFIKARSTALREQQRLLDDLREIWEQECRRREERSRQSRAAAEKARTDYLQLREAYRQRLAELNERSRLVAERELILRQAEQFFCSQHDAPAAAERELQRRHQHWARLAARPFKALRHRAQELDRRAARQEAYRRYLLNVQQQLDADHAALSRQRIELQAQRAELAADRQRWLKEIQGWREERAWLLQHNADLKEQIERLVLALANHDPPDPPLALVA